MLIWRILDLVISWRRRVLILRNFWRIYLRKGIYLQETSKISCPWKMLDWTNWREKLFGNYKLGKNQRKLRPELFLNTKRWSFGLISANSKERAISKRKNSSRKLRLIWCLSRENWEPNLMSSGEESRKYFFSNKNCRRK